MTDVAGKRILVTGATGALGSRIAQQLHSAGATLVLTGTSPEKLQALGLPVELYALDLSLPGSAQSLIQTVTSAGQLDGIVAAHGVVAFGPVAELDAQTLQQLQAINQTSPIELITSAIPSLSSAKAAGSEPFVLTISGSSQTCPPQVWLLMAPPRQDSRHSFLRHSVNCAVKAFELWTLVHPTPRQV